MNATASAFGIAALLALSSGCTTSRLETYRGFLIIGPEVETFTLCGTDDPLWITYSPSLREALFKRYEQLKAAPYDKTYAELQGAPGPKLDCGFCDEYSGSFKVDAVVIQRSKTLSDCDDT